MKRYEYKLVTAPERAGKIKGLKGADRFAATLEDVMNTLGAEGWQYLRADTLPQEVRAGLTGKQTIYRNILVFLRELPDDAEDVQDADSAVAAADADANDGDEPDASSHDFRDEDDEEASLMNLFQPDEGDPAPLDRKPED